MEHWTIPCRRSARCRLDSAGRGGQGTVHLAFDTRLKREVAVKILGGFDLASEEAKTRFRREAEIASRISHPAICPVFEAGEVGDIAYISMSYVAGETLARQIESIRAKTESGTTGGPSRSSLASDDHVARVTLLLEKVARAVQVAHEHGIVHRDLKPGNIMIARDGEPVVLDFGLARDLTGEHATLTRTVQTLGTPAYMSPEQLLGRSLDLDRRTDVWSLGACLYEALALRPPFEAATRQGLVQAILTEDPRRPRMVNPSVSRELETVVASALEKDVHRRYATALALAEDLRRIREREPITARPAGLLLRGRRWTERHPAVSATMALLATMLGITLYFLNTKRILVEDLTRFSDYGDFARLMKSADELWPAIPDNVDRMKAWLEDAARIISRRSIYESRLRVIDARARPRTERERDWDRLQRAKRSPGAVQLVERHELELERVRRLGNSARALELEQLLEQERPALQFLDERMTWTFDSQKDLREHEILSVLVVQLNTLKATGDQIRKRIEDARRLGEPISTAMREAWTQVADELSADHRFQGHRLVPQAGLVPIGRDPRTSLQEFAFPQTGTIPARDRHTGMLMMQDDCALVLVLVPGGTFRMGAQNRDKSAANYDEHARDDEGPVEEVTLAPFFVSKFEMTQYEWLHVTGQNPSEFNKGAKLPLEDEHGSHYTSVHYAPRQPVEQVSGHDAERWMERLELRLPTEAQWEYFCRAGASGPYAVAIPPEGSLAKVANVARPGEGATENVGSYPPNGFGLYDVHGNVAEWCIDGKAPYSQVRRLGDGFSFSDKPWAMSVRGGSFQTPVEASRCATRLDSSPVNVFVGVGIRPIRPIRERP